jgi:hypothetical protein
MPSFVSVSIPTSFAASGLAPNPQCVPFDPSTFTIGKGGKTIRPEYDRDDLGMMGPADPSQDLNAGKSYGKTVRVDREVELRRFPSLPRKTKKFERM